VRREDLPVLACQARAGIDAMYLRKSSAAGVFAAASGNGIVTEGVSKAVPLTISTSLGLSRVAMQKEMRSAQCDKFPVFYGVSFAFILICDERA
jgi:hypothetical protein